MYQLPSQVAELPALQLAGGGEVNIRVFRLPEALGRDHLLLAGDAAGEADAAAAAAAVVRVVSEAVFRAAIVELVATVDADAAAFFACVCN